MSSAKKIKAGEAFIVIRATDRASAQFKAIGKAFDRLGARIRNVGLGLTALGGGILSSFIRPLKVASEVTEQQNKFFQVFGDEIGRDVEQRMIEIANATGRTHLKMYRFAAMFGGMAKGYGATTEMAAKVSKALLKMGVDFSSFNDILDDTREGSMNRFNSALGGSAEVLDRFGVAAKQTALEPMLERMFDVNIKSATELQKQLARVVLIFESMKRQGALDDAVRTQHELANVVRNIKDQWYAIQYTIGMAIIPIVGKLAQKVLKVALAVRIWLEQNKVLIVTLFTIGAALTAIGVILTAIGITSQLIGFIWAGLAAAMNPLVMTLLAMGAALYVFRHQFIRLTDFMKTRWQGTLNAMTKAVLAGDITAAFKTLKFSIQAEIQGIFNYWMDKLDELSKYFHLLGNFLTSPFDFFSDDWLDKINESEKAIYELYRVRKLERDAALKQLQIARDVEIGEIEQKQYQRKPSPSDPEVKAVEQTMGLAIPKAFEKGTAAAYRRGIENRQAKSLEELKDMTDEGNKDRKEGLRLLEEVFRVTEAI